MQKTIINLRVKGGGKGYVVTSVTNRLAPRPGTFITEDEAEALVAESQKAKATVTVNVAT